MQRIGRAKERERQRERERARLDGPPPECDMKVQGYVNCTADKISCYQEPPPTGPAPTPPPPLGHPGNPSCHAYANSQHCCAFSTAPASSFQDSFGPGDPYPGDCSPSSHRGSQLRLDPRPPTTFQDAQGCSEMLREQVDNLQGFLQGFWRGFFARIFCKDFCKDFWKQILEGFLEKKFVRIFVRIFWKDFWKQILEGFL